MFWRPAWGLAVLAFAALAPSACSLLLPFNDLSSGSQSATSEGDAGPPSIEAGPFPDGSWCAAQAAGMSFCDDFDFETTAFERWSATEFAVQGSGELSDVAESPPHSFQMSLPAFTSGTYAEAVLQENVLPKPSATSLSLSFAFRPAYPWDAGEDGDVYVASIMQGPGVPRSAVALALGPSGASLAEQVTSLDGGSTFPPFQSSPFVPPPGQWTHVAVDMDFAAATATVSFEGTVAFTLALQGNWSPSASTTVDLGDWYITSTTGFDVLFDDAVIRQQ